MGANMKLQGCDRHISTHYVATGHGGHKLIVERWELAIDCTDVPSSYNVLSLVSDTVITSASTLTRVKVVMASWGVNIRRKCDGHK